MKRKNEFTWAYYGIVILCVSAIAKRMHLLHLIPFEVLIVTVAIFFVLLGIYNHVRKIAEELK